MSSEEYDIDDELGLQSEEEDEFEEFEEEEESFETPQHQSQQPESIIGRQVLDSLTLTLADMIKPQMNELQQQMQTLQQRIDASDQTFASLGKVDSHTDFIKAMLDSYQQFSIAVQSMSEDQRMIKEHVLKTYNIIDTFKDTIHESIKANTTDPNQEMIQLLSDIKQLITPPSQEEEQQEVMITPHQNKKSFFHFFRKKT